MNSEECVEMGRTVEVLGSAFDEEGWKSRGGGLGRRGLRDVAVRRVGRAGLGRLWPSDGDYRMNGKMCERERE